MSDRPSLIVRVLPTSGVRSLPGNVATDAPAPPSGFGRTGEISALTIFRGQELVWAAPLANAELRALGRTIARAALVGVPRFQPDRPDETSLEACYRALLDFIFAPPLPPHLLAVEMLESQEQHVDVLWRLGLAMEARLTIRDSGDRLRVELFPVGRRGDLAALVSTRPHVLPRAWLRAVRTTFSNRKTAGQDLLAVLAHDVEEPLPPIKLALPVEFSEAPAEEVRRRPRRFGIGLTAAADDLGRRHQFVGRIGGRTVFHLVCHRAAPALDLLSPSLRSQLVDPVALITDARTEPEFRNRSIFAAGMQWTAQWARQQGIRTVATLIQIDNLPSLRAAAKAGFRRLGEVTVLR